MYMNKEDDGDEFDVTFNLKFTPQNVVSLTCTVRSIRFFFLLKIPIWSINIKQALTVSFPLTIPFPFVLAIL